MGKHNTMLVAGFARGSFLGGNQRGSPEPRLSERLETAIYPARFSEFVMEVKR
jgi:hypothetical protein